MVGSVNNLARFPDSWVAQADAFKSLVKDTNSLLTNKNYEQASEGLFELCYGCLEYLEVDVRELVGRGERQITINPRIKYYQDQLLSIMEVLEEIAQADPDAVSDRYVLDLEVFKKLVYIDLDGINVFTSFIRKVTSNINPKKTLPRYIDEFIIFGTEIAILACEARNETLSTQVFQELAELVAGTQHNNRNMVLPLVGLAVSYERQEQYKEAQQAYKEAARRILALEEDQLQPEMIHEVVAYGFVTQYLSRGDLEDEEEFSHLLSKCQPEVRDFLTNLRLIFIFGFDFGQSFPDYTNEGQIREYFDYYFQRSQVHSSQANNPTGLFHVGADRLLPKISETLAEVGAQRGLVILESQFLKELQVIAGKGALPLLNVRPGITGNYVEVEGLKITVEEPFAFGMSFTGELDLSINYKKTKGLVKKKLNVKDKTPALFHLNLTSEIEEASILKEGGVKEFGQLWPKKMTLVQVVRNIAHMPTSSFTFSGEGEQKDFLRELGQLFRKVGLKKVETIIGDLTKQTGVVLQGKALKLVILQRISELEGDNPEISQIVSEVATEK